MSRWSPGLHGVLQAGRSRAGGDPIDRRFQRIVALLVWFIITPTVGLLIVAILMLWVAEARARAIFSLLVVTLVGCLITAAALALYLLRREARLSRLQIDFVSKVSHELRTPLTSISMFVETLRDNRVRDPDQIRQCLDILQRETSRLRDEIERLLDWGRMQSGRKVYALAVESVESIVQDAVDTVRPALASRNQTLECHLDGRLPRAAVDRSAMVGAIVNLVSNASKYSDEGSAVELGAGASEDGVRIWVKDHGIGIPRAEHRNIFRQFYRVDESLSRRVEGSGLGLAIVRHVVRGHGGRIELDSAPGKGSTFTILLPLPRGE